MRTTLTLDDSLYQQALELADLARLRPAQQALQPEVQAFIEHERLCGLGCGLVNVSLLASTRMTPGARLWTLDKPLVALALRFGVRWP